MPHTKHTLIQRERHAEAMHVEAAAAVARVLGLGEPEAERAIT